MRFLIVVRLLLLFLLFLKICIFDLHIIYLKLHVFFLNFILKVY